MSDRDNTDPPKRVATPAFLHQRLLCFRVGAADRQTYVLRDNVRGTSYDFEPWQFFLLEVMPGCTDPTQLSGVFEDRFGRTLQPRELDDFLASLADAQLLNDAAQSHPLLARFAKKTYVVEGEHARPRSHRTLVAGQAAPAAGLGGGAAVAVPNAVRPAPAASKSPDEDETLPAGMQGSVDFDPRVSPWMWVLFNPTWLLKLVVPLLAPLRHLIFALPLALVGALVLASRNAPAIAEDLTRLLGEFDVFKHWVLSLLTVNLAVTCTTAIAAFKYRATVSGFGVALVMRFYPRFATRIGHLDQLSRVERMWVHGAPLLMRLALFCAGIYTWFIVRGAHSVLASWALAITVTSAISLLISANPLIKSSGNHLLAAFTNEPHLRGKALKAMLNKIRGGTFKEANELLLATYAITMAAFMFVLVVGAAAFTGFALHQLHLGGSAIIVACLVGFVLLRRVFNYFGKVEAAYDRSLQFDRWRKRTHRQDEAERGGQDSAQPRGFASYVWRAVLLTLVVAMFLPYAYNAGGTFVIHPRLEQVLTTDVSGRIEKVFFNGGEAVAKGTVVARLAATEAGAQAKIYEMRMDEQQAVLDDLEARPVLEDVQVARMALAVARTRVEFSRLELKRLKRLTADGVAPLEELDDARRTIAVDKKRRAQKQAELEVAELGPTEFEIAEAEAKLESLAAQRDASLDRVRRSEVIMPFDGRLLTLHLKEKGNGYYRSGDVFATAEAAGPMTAEIELPEAEAEHVRVGSTVQLRPVAYSSKVFTGTVVHIDWVVTERPFGNIIKVIAAVDDEAGLLKNGMTGYSKIDGPRLLVWEAFSQQIVRFVQVQVWSWIP